MVLLSKPVLISSIIMTKRGPTIISPAECVADKAYNAVQRFVAGEFTPPPAGRGEGGGERGEKYWLESQGSLGIQSFLLFCDLGLGMA